MDEESYSPEAVSEENELVGNKNLARDFKFRDITSFIFHAVER